MNDRKNDKNLLTSSEEFRDKISTIDAQGHRIWVYPKKPKGSFYSKRKLVSYLLLITLLGLPFIKYRDKPLILFNVFERKFIILGQIFITEDFYILALTTITIIVGIVLFTVVFGRIFCGWFCPQTIFMEMVFRRIEYLIEGDYQAQKKLKKQSWNKEKIIKKGLKHIVFLSIAFIIMHTFTSYIIGTDNLFELLQSSPLENKAGFIGITALTLIFYGIFSKLREQVCTSICPYGRLQGVLLDKQSIVVAYDHKRGEKRGKLRKNIERDKIFGDCIDCNQCVQVCPTGIDIRNGTQLECTNCTACIDACNNIMARINKPKGLIRYTSIESIEENTVFRFTSRMAAYTAVLVLLLCVLTSFIFTRTDTTIHVTRVSGQTFQRRPNQKITNLYRILAQSKTLKNTSIAMELNPESKGELEIAGEDFRFNEKGQVEAIFFIIRDESDINNRKEKIIIELKHNNRVLDVDEVYFVSPRNLNK